MKSYLIKDIMIPKEEYILAQQDISLFDIIISLKEQKKSSTYHSTILIIDNENRLKGKITIIDILRGIEPKYKELSHMDLTRFGYNDDYIFSILKKQEFWVEPLKDLCNKLPTIKIKDIMQNIEQTETIKAEMSLDIAVHKMVINNHNILFVYNANNEFLGVLRSIDIFDLLCNTIAQCNIK
ncbi:CBS domain-containing protein [Desulfonauticus submarinus]|uniref:CBS domain-containing protein n=1 Tax=Desulfonauticus submarinus TaxID=206665 RepID=A0A1H0E6W1_9BACT|nr:CBS domain-containing protein [Desulfonauticus submarinus]SDN78170.1 CBS domain-containing protein [Desulfonauticus submarinus]